MFKSLFNKIARQKNSKSNPTWFAFTQDYLLVQLNDPEVDSELKLVYYKMLETTKVFDAAGLTPLIFFNNDSGQWYGTSEEARKGEFH